MSEEKKKILQMLSDGKIDVEQAEKLLTAVGKSSDREPNEAKTKPSGNGKPKFLRVKVIPKEGHRHKEEVNIKIPVMLIKAGIKIGSVIPGKSQDKISEHLKKRGLDVDLGKLDDNSLDAILTALGETAIDINDEKERVRIYCE
ncbi:MAG: hypothetical protein KAR42_12125 [candidate division Zixibacteria bacterium]|nr:hypothetical protein [candidate division Zixibacteria bacterium]